MTEAAEGIPTSSIRPAPRPSQSFARRVGGDSVARVGAKLGLAWIGLVALCAVFAPFFANSRPLLLKMDGLWSSPLLAELTPADVWLLVVFFTGALLLATRSLPAPLRWAIGMVLALTLLPAVSWTFWIHSLAQVVRDNNDWAWLWRILRPLTAGWATTLVSAAFTAALVAMVILLLARAGKLRTTAAWIIVLWTAAVSIPWVVAPVVPPSLTSYDTYRRADREGRIEFQVLAPIPYSPRDRLRDFTAVGMVPPWWAHSSDASAEVRLERRHWLGNEANGADMASRMIHACRIALSIGFIATGIAIVIGVVLGGFMGYYSGRLDLIGMRLVEIFEFIPTLFLLLMFVAFFGRNIYFIMVIIGLTSWTGYARFVRAEFLKLRKQDFVQAAIACGLPLRSILFRHMLPNGITPVLVSASFGVASAILFEATLSFLGLGLVDEPSWGELLNQSVRSTGTFPWWIAIFPGGAIFLTVFAYNLIGESLRDAIDPHLKKSAHM